MLDINVRGSVNKVWDWLNISATSECFFLKVCMGVVMSLWSLILAPNVWMSSTMATFTVEQRAYINIELQALKFIILCKVYVATKHYHVQQFLDGLLHLRTGELK